MLGGHTSGNPRAPAMAALIFIGTSNLLAMPPPSTIVRPSMPGMLLTLHLFAMGVVQLGGPVAVVMFDAPLAFVSRWRFLLTPP